MEKRCRECLPRNARIEAHLVLHKTRGDGDHLQKAWRLLREMVERAPPESRDAMRENVPLHREIELAQAS